MSSSSGGPGHLEDARTRASFLVTKLVRALCPLITLATLARLSHALSVGFQDPGGSGGACRVFQPNSPHALVRVGP